jgi:hypothetical protein
MGGGSVKTKAKRKRAKKTKKTGRALGIKRAKKKGRK